MSKDLCSWLSARIIRSAPVAFQPVTISHVEGVNGSLDIGVRIAMGARDATLDRRELLSRSAAGGGVAARSAKSADR